MIRVYPKFDDDVFIKLFHKGVKAQWTASDVDWERPLQFNPANARALAHMLTPVYLGEQSAMIGASVVLPQMAMAGETTSQIYLSSFLIDEARHFEVLTRLYQRLQEDPVNVRQMPEMLRYHNRLRKGDRVDWVWGILISDIFAKNFYKAFAKSQPEALFGSLSERILQDESRHQAFAEHYLKRAMPVLGPERRSLLLQMRDELFQTMDAMYLRLNDDASRLGIDGRVFLDNLLQEIERKAKKIGIDQSESFDDGHGPHRVKRLVRSMRDGLKNHTEDPSSKFQGLHTSGCNTCFLSLLCQSRLVTNARCV